MCILCCQNKEQCNMIVQSSLSFESHLFLFLNERNAPAHWTFAGEWIYYYDFKIFARMTDMIVLSTTPTLFYRFVPNLICTFINSLMSTWYTGFSKFWNFLNDFHDFAFWRILHIWHSCSCAFFTPLHCRVYNCTPFVHLKSQHVAS